jgi:hypothetical protein
VVDDVLGENSAAAMRGTRARPLARSRWLALNPARELPDLLLQEIAAARIHENADAKASARSELKDSLLFGAGEDEAALEPGFVKL